jgi:Ni,Fe-hydrogenase maturation factor
MSNCKTIYLVGNLLVEEDSLPIKLKPDLEKAFPDIDFREFDPTEDLPEDTEELVIIDTVLGIKEPHVFTDIDQFSTQKNYSMHDFDLGWQLKLYKKLRMINEVKIIGVPPEGDKDEILEKLSTQVVKIL